MILSCDPVPGIWGAVDETVLNKVQFYASVVDNIGRQCHCNQSDLGKDVTTCVIDTSSPVSTTSVVNFPPVSLIKRCTLSCKYLRKLSRTFEMTPKGQSGAWGKQIHKISWPCPFKRGRTKTPCRHLFGFLFFYSTRSMWEIWCHCFGPEFSQLSRLSLRKTAISSGE